MSDMDPEVLLLIKDIHADRGANVEFRKNLGVTLVRIEGNVTDNTDRLVGIEKTCAARHAATEPSNPSMKDKAKKVGFYALIASPGGLAILALILDKVVK